MADRIDGAELLRVARETIERVGVLALGKLREALATEIDGP